MFDNDSFYGQFMMVPDLPKPKTISWHKTNPSPEELYRLRPRLCPCCTGPLNRSDKCPWCGVIIPQDEFTLQQARTAAQQKWADTQIMLDGITIVPKDEILQRSKAVMKAYYDERLLQDVKLYDRFTRPQMIFTREPPKKNWIDALIAFLSALFPKKPREEEDDDEW